MVIIGFSDKTSLPVVRMICGRLKHCVIITQHNKNFVLHQFVKHHNVAQIAISSRGIAQLESCGWVFIYLDCSDVELRNNAWTCVGFVKRAIGIKNIWIQTPNSLYKYLNKNLT